MLGAWCGGGGGVVRVRRVRRERLGGGGGGAAVVGGVVLARCAGGVVGAAMGGAGPAAGSTACGPGGLSVMSASVGLPPQDTTSWPLNSSAIICGVMVTRSRARGLAGGRSPVEGVGEGERRLGENAGASLGDGVGVMACDGRPERSCPTTRMCLF